MGGSRSTTRRSVHLPAFEGVDELFLPKSLRARGLGKLVYVTPGAPPQGHPPLPYTNFAPAQTSNFVYFHPPDPLPENKLAASAPHGALARPGPLPATVLPDHIVDLLLHRIQ